MASSKQRKGGYFQNIENEDIYKTKKGRLSSKYKIGGYIIQNIKEEDVFKT